MVIEEKSSDSTFSEIDICIENKSAVSPSIGNLLIRVILKSLKVVYRSRKQ